MKKVTRRNVIASFSASSIFMCPAILNAQTATFDWGQEVPTNMPRGEDRLIEVSMGEAVDITDLGAGEVAVLALATDNPEYENTNQIHYVAVLRRTADQIAFAQTNERPDTVQDMRYFVVSLTCPHRGYAVGITGEASNPFACTKQGNRHSSVFDSVGLGVDGKSSGEYMTIPAYDLTIDGSDDDISKATLALV